MPKKIAIIATCLTTGNVTRFATMMEAATKGGFEYSGVMACVHGRTPQYVGHTFKREDAAQYRPRGRVVQISELYKAGQTIREIADDLGLKYKSVATKVIQARHLGLLPRAA